MASLTAVFKKGDATSLNNYRAIGALFGKLYSVLLDTRMSTVAEKEGWRAEGQAGFRPEKSTVDHVFVLRHLIEASQLLKATVRVNHCSVALWILERHMIW